MIRTAVIPVLLTLICARQAAGAPDGPDAQGTGVGLSLQSFRSQSRSGRTCEPNLSGTTGADPQKSRASDGRKSVK